MAKVKRIPNRKPQTIDERVALLEFYVAKIVKALKIEDPDTDLKWG